MTTHKPSSVTIPAHDLHLHINGYKKHDQLGEFFPLIPKGVNVIVSKQDKIANRNEIKSAKLDYKAFLKNPTKVEESLHSLVKSFTSITPTWGDNSRVKFL